MLHDFLFCFKKTTLFWDDAKCKVLKLFLNFSVSYFFHPIFSFSKPALKITKDVKNARSVQVMGRSYGQGRFPSSQFLLLCPNLWGVRGTSNRGNFRAGIRWLLLATSFHQSHSRTGPMEVGLNCHLNRQTISFLQILPAHNPVHKGPSFY